MQPGRLAAFDLLLVVVAVTALACACFELRAAGAGVIVSKIVIDETPATVYRPASGAPSPVILIAHGFAGSQQLMQSFALAFARHGYVAVTFDFLGHGRNPLPLTGSITDPNGATRTLLEQTRNIAAVARTLGDGRLAVLGHSMATDVVVRFAETAPDVSATIAVSMFSPAVTATSPRNLLVIVGDWETQLKREALRAAGLATAPGAARAGITYGDPAKGTGRRVAFSAGVEHVGVLYSRDSLREALQWLDRCFAMDRGGLPLESRGPWIALLLAGAVLLARPLSALLPRVGTGLGAGIPWSRLWLPLLVPPLATPLLLRVLPTHFLPVLVGDYLAAHFAVYGLLTVGCVALVGHDTSAAARSTGPVALVVATAAVILYGFVALVWPIDTFVTSFIPGHGRGVLVLALLGGTLPYFLSDEWLTHGDAAARGAYAATKIAFLASLGIAVALDPERLFFLIIIVPVIAVFFLVYGLISRWTYRRTGHPLVAGFANAVAFAWAIGVTFPLLRG